MSRLTRLVVGLLGLVTVGSVTVAGMWHVVRFSVSAGTPLSFHRWTTVGQAVLTFTLPLLLIVLAHELGHLALCRFYRLRTSGPFLFPLPSLMTGMVGAGLLLHDPPPSQDASWQIGLAGLVAGLTMALPLTMIGLSLSHVGTRAGAFQSLPWLMRAFGADQLVLHPTALAARYGLWLTAINALPLWPMDGWRVLRAMWRGTRQPLWARIVLGGSVLGTALVCWPF